MPSAASLAKADGRGPDRLDKHLLRTSNGSPPSILRVNMRSVLTGFAALFAGALPAAMAVEQGNAIPVNCAAAFVSNAQALLPRHKAAIESASPATPTTLKALGQHDQEIRAILRLAMQTCAHQHHGEEMQPIVRVMRRIDVDNQGVLRGVLQSSGWPARSTWGADAADAAFLIVQHADQAPALQEQGLALLEPLVARGEAPSDEFALLFDRVRVNAGKPQRYGTQGNCRGKAWKPLPLEDADQVDKFRAAVGLSPLAEYADVASTLGCQR